MVDTKATNITKRKLALDTLFPAFGSHKISFKSYLVHGFMFKIFMLMHKVSIVDKCRA